MIYLILSFVFFIAAIIVSKYLKLGIPESILIVLTLSLAWPLIILAGVFYLIFDCFFQAYRIIFGEEL